jgi:FMN reductase
MTEGRALIVGVGGTTRVGSTSEAALRISLAAAERLGARTMLFAGEALALEAYDPSSSRRSARASALVAALRRADGVIIATPSYHGSISGLVKNAIDYTEDLRDDPRPYLDGRAVGCIVCADGSQAMGSTLSALRSIVHALRGWPTPLAAVVNSSLDPFAPQGECRDASLARQLETVAALVVEFARMRSLLLQQASACHAI